MSSSTVGSGGSGDRFAFSSVAERRASIAQFVTEQGFCMISELSMLYQVSDMTIRRDIARLVGEGKLRGFHGGVASLAPQDMLGRDYIYRDVAMSGPKQAIAARAVQLLSPGEVIAIDAGTTASRMAPLLPDDLGLNIVTPSHTVVSALVGNAGVQVTSLGGVLHAESMSFSGPATVAAVSNLQIDTFFLGASGIGDRGAFCGPWFDASTKRALIDAADKVVLLADSSKFSTSAMVKICGWDAIDTIITDTGLTAEQTSMLEKNGVDVVTVELPAYRQGKQIED